ncbi:MAG: fatty acid desaturase, partial [Betaproteobacteria bacterium]|nr:fatty acid desaturase [Betaproteobacteria bacterium]
MTTTQTSAIDTGNIPVIAPDAPFPGRKTVRTWLLPLCGKSTVLPLLLLAFDFALFFAAIAGTVLVSAPWAKIGLGLMA